jgi:hypothetical protein
MRQCLETTARLPTFTPTPTLQKGTKIISHLKSQIPRYTPNHPTPTQKKRIKNKSSLNPKDIPKIPNIPTKIPLKKISFPPPGVPPHPHHPPRRTFNTGSSGLHVPPRRYHRRRGLSALSGVSSARAATKGRWCRWQARARSPSCETPGKTVSLILQCGGPVR